MARRRWYRIGYGVGFPLVIVFHRVGLPIFGLTLACDIVGNVREIRWDRRRGALAAAPGGEG
jgi:hypothetical protein